MNLFFKLILILISLNLNSVVAEDNIVAIVGHTPITKYDLQLRSKFLHFMSGNAELEASNVTKLRHAALHSLIDDQLFIQEADKYKIKISDDEIKSAISTIEQNNKLPKGSFIAQLKANGISLDTLHVQIKSQLIRQKLVYGKFGREAEVTQSEVNQAAASADKTFTYKLKKIIANDTNSVAKLKLLSSKIKDCNMAPELYNHFAHIEDISALESQMNTKDKFQLEKLSGKVATDPIHNNNQDYIIVLCSKKIAGITDNEYDYIANVLGNRKIAILGQKYHQKLLKSTYIKIF